jgi:hypothetical protein
MADDSPERRQEELVLKPGESEIRDRIEALRVEKGYPPLPHVTLRVEPPFKDRADFIYTTEEAMICVDGEPVGFCNLVTYEGAEPQYIEEPPARLNFGYISTQRLREQQRGSETPRENVPRGVGLASYLLAIELASKRGVPFVSGTTPTDSAKRVWEILSETGMVHHAVKRRNSQFPEYVIPPEGGEFNDADWGELTSAHTAG